MDAVGRTVHMTIARSKNRKVFHECTVTEYIQSYDGCDWSYYWTCLNEHGNTLSFDWDDIVQGSVSFLPDGYANSDVQ
jgi:hypothetical protein